METPVTAEQGAELVRVAQSSDLHAMDWAQASLRLHKANTSSSSLAVALGDCCGWSRLRATAVTTPLRGSAELWQATGAVWMVWRRKGGGLKLIKEAQNLTFWLSEALAFYGARSNIRDRDKGVQGSPNLNQNGGLLASWDAATAKADIVVAQDGSGSCKTINEAVAALARMGDNRPERVIIYVKSGVYNEEVEVGRDMKNLMFAGDGMDKTVVTGNQNVQDGASTLNSATVGVSGDGFWARDMTFENTAGPHKHQAVALRVSSDLSVFYRCSVKGFQDTLLVHSLRQFYRDCHIYGTVDFIFGDASERDNSNENTGISIENSRVRPSPEFAAVKDQFKNYLGKPWERYSRTVFLKTYLDGLIDPKGWTEWSGDFALSSLYYGEYMNVGVGASTAKRVKWPGFHVLSNPVEASPFTVQNFIQGESWIHSGDASALGAKLLKVVQKYVVYILGILLLGGMLSSGDKLGTEKEYDIKLRLSQWYMTIGNI
ncbi:hypothetical protein RJ639_034196 [Escallonia herrerae]|uniref:Pectinesterase n=1 Tax=Escallonia herrerae TaxID=1293975 RepID=A0AA88WVP1_9ASTE|nr:hypothetical protein RJ639_034196 [Escallonia herrerae]